MRETARAKQAWADYLSLGPGRSLETLLDRYQSATDSPPTRRLKTLKDWSRTFGWQARLKTIADQVAREAAEREAEYRREIMEAGYGKREERVKALKELAGILFDELMQPDKRWCRDVKQIGSGEGAERVDVERFNAAEVEQFRGLLDDIAKEKGERKNVTELTGKDGGPIEVSDARERILSRLASLAAGATAAGGVGGSDR